MNSEVYGIIMSICNGRCRLKKLVKDDLDLVNKYMWKIRYIGLISVYVMDDVD